ncbi:MAG: carboxypeptidase regulatory-like domain-containing protein [Acidobacteriota bacterium]
MTSVIERVGHRIPGSAVALFCVAATCPLAFTAPAPGSIRGRVTVSDYRVTVEPRPMPSSLGGTHAPRPVELRPAVVYLESAPRGAFERDDARATMDQRNETFVPHVLAITVGTTVDFPNSDVIFHNVFSLSKAKTFDLGRYARGKSKSVRFDRPGVVQVFCDIHSHMSAYILVFSHRYFSVTDAEGRYALEGVPSGAYTVVVWHEGAVRETRAVIVPATGNAAVADFAIR